MSAGPAAHRSRRPRHLEEAWGLIRSQSPRVRVDRLSGPDLSCFVPETRGWAADIGAIAVLQGTRSPDGDGTVRIGEVRARIAARLRLAPRLRQVVHRPGPGLGGPLWVDAARFDIADHVRLHALPEGSGLEELLQACERLRRRPMDRSRPLWQLWLLPGLSGGRVGMFLRLHHAMADGLAGVALIGVLFDASPDPEASPPAPWAACPLPSRGDLVRDNLRRRAAALARGVSGLGRAASAAGRCGRAWPQLKGFLDAQRAPRTSLNQTIGPDRRLAVVSCELATVKEAARRAGATVNDALLAVVAGGLRELLLHRGEAVAGLVLNAMVPVALRPAAEAAAGGNLYGVMVVPLPVGEPDVARRLRLVAARTAERKAEPGRAWGTGLLGWPPLQRLALRLATGQHAIAVHVANVPGPEAPVYLAGARVLSVFPLVSLSGNLTIGIGALSYAGRLAVTAVADRRRCPDLAAFTSGADRALADLAGPR